jgi:hypothetical protein
MNSVEAARDAVAARLGDRKPTIAIVWVPALAVWRI